MDNILIMLAIIGLTRAFYIAIGEPLTNHNSNSILYFYTDFLSKLICKLHKIKDYEFEAFYSALPKINQYYKWAGFCYICFSFWVMAIFWLLNTNSIQEFLTMLGVNLTINYITWKN
jgi:hypothetical protein